MNTNKRLERNVIARAEGPKQSKNEIASSSQSRPGLLAMTAGRIAVTIVSLFLLVYAAMLNPEPAFAGASVTVSSGAWAIGTKKASAATTSSGFTVTNAASGGTEDITISVGNSTSGWTPAATAGSNQFVLRMTDVNGQVITATPYTLFTGLANNATSSAFTLYFMTPASVTAGEGVQQTITVTLTATGWVFVWPGCGSNLVVTHTSGTVAPVNKTVTYGTTSSTLTGSAKCWITQNLGADIRATAATDASEAAAGWYWQFNRAQGFKHDGTTRTPTTTWITSINESSDWTSANDPCLLLLGTGWRLPTSAEWTYADGASGGNWANYNDTYASVLKLHAAGYLGFSGGALSYRGSSGYGWSSAQSSAAGGWNLGFGSGGSDMYSDYKAYGFSARCLKD